MALLSKTPRKQPPLNIYLRVLTIRIHPRSPAFMRVAGVLQGRLKSLQAKKSMILSKMFVHMTAVKL
jgi:hypothetical protein